MTLPKQVRFRQTSQMSTADGSDEVADRLYALAPASFIAARDAAAKEARAAGDRERAAMIAKLRRPTVAAWMVNLLALQRPDRLAELFEIGREMRAAQHELRGTALRDLATRRRTAVAALVTEASDLASQAGAARAGLPVGEVETTLVAAMADDDLADAVRAGRLLKAGHYDGFGEMPRPKFQVIEGGGPADDDTGTGGAGTAGAGTGGTGTGGIGTAATDHAVEEAGASAEQADRKPTERDSKRADQRADARQRLTASTAALADAERDYAAAAEAVEARIREVTEIEEHLTQLRRERIAAHAALREAQAAKDVRDASRESARRALAAAERAGRRAGL